MQFYGACIDNDQLYMVTGAHACSWVQPSVMSFAQQQGGHAAAEHLTITCPHPHLCMLGRKKICRQAAAPQM